MGEVVSGEVHRAIALAAAVLAICLALFIQTNRQPQHQAFALLETPPASPTEAEALLSRQEAIRAGLLNAYLSPFRYFSATGEVRTGGRDMLISAISPQILSAPRRPAPGPVSP